MSWYYFTDDNLGNINLGQKYITVSWCVHIFIRTWIDKYANLSYIQIRINVIMYKLNAIFLKRFWNFGRYSFWLCTQYQVCNIACKLIFVLPLIVVKSSSHRNWWLFCYLQIKLKSDHALFGAKANYLTDSFCQRGQSYGMKRVSSFLLSPWS